MFLEDKAVGEVLRRAAAAAATSRLGVSTLVRAHGGFHCIMGILQTAARDDAQLFDRALRTLHRRVSTAEFVDGREIVSWYDAILPDRDAIVDVLKTIG